MQSVIQQKGNKMDHILEIKKCGTEWVMHLTGEISGVYRIDRANLIQAQLKKTDPYLLVFKYNRLFNKIVEIEVDSKISNEVNDKILDVIREDMQSKANWGGKLSRVYKGLLLLSFLYIAAAEGVAWKWFPHQQENIISANIPLHGENSLPACTWDDKDEELMRNSAGITDGLNKDFSKFGLHE